MRALALGVALWLAIPWVAVAQAPEAGEEGTASSSPSPSSSSSPSSSPSPSPSPSSRLDDEDDEDDEDDDEGDPYDFLYIDVAAGVSYVDLRALNADNYYPEFVRLSGVGPAGSVGAGFRIEFLSVGVRGSIASYGDAFDVGTATAEISLALPIPVVKPYLRLGFGLGWHGDSDFNAPMNSQTTVFGFAFSGAVGVDIYFVHWFSIGAAVSLDILNMSRQSFNQPVVDAGMVEFTETGDAVGIQARGQAGVTFHL